jgi:hypothetical protein
MRKLAGLVAALLLFAGRAPAAEEARLLRFPTTHDDTRLVLIFLDNVVLGRYGAGRE